MYGAAQCFRLSWGREETKQVSHTLYIFFCGKGKAPSFFPLSLSLLKAPRQLKDMHVESEYQESMWKTILLEDHSENLYFSELCAISWITPSDLMYCLVIAKNITWYIMHYVSFDYASRERHGIQRENKGRMMAVYWLINLHLSTVNLNPLCCQSCTPTAAIAGIWKSRLWDPFVHSHICTAFLGSLFSVCSVPHQPGTPWFETSRFPFLCSLCATLHTDTHQFKLQRKKEKNPQETVKVTNNHVLDNIFQAYTS